MNTGGATQLKIPYAPGAALTKQQADLPALTLRAEAAGQALVTAALVRLDDAAPGLDAYDQFAPPMPFGGLALAFDEPALDAGPTPLGYTRLLVNARPATSGLARYTLVLTSEPGAPVRLTPSHLGVLAFQQAMLHDLGTGAWHPLADDATLTLAPTRGARRLHLYIGSAAELAAARASTTPTVFALHPPYPNPARDALTAQVDVPASTPGSRLLLDVYDLVGRRMTRLVDRPALAGAQQVWMGEAVAMLGSGTYVLVATLDGERRVTRFVVAR